MANDQLLQYYERELTFLRRMGARFAQEYPKIASRLDLEPSKCEDPHVERMLEAFAFLAARVHKRIDEDVPEISEALLEIVYPHYVRPIPSMSLVEFELDREQGKLTSGLPVPRNSLLYSRPVAGVPCKFTTCYDTTLWPVRVASLEWMTPDRLKPAVRVTDAVAALRLELHCFADLEFKALDLSALRLHLAGDSGVTFALYELLCNNCTSIIVREPGGKKSLTLPASSRATACCPTRAARFLATGCCRSTSRSRRSFSSSIWRSSTRCGLPASARRRKSSFSSASSSAASDGRCSRPGCRRAPCASAARRW